MPLLQLVYISTMVTDEPDLLISVLDASVQNNKRKNLTGMLLYADGNIIQALEGEEYSVLNTFKAIQDDIRHRGIQVLIQKEVASRQFASWSMGCRRLTHAELEKFPAVTPIFNALQDEISLRVRAGKALTLLKSFARTSI